MTNNGSITQWQSPLSYRPIVFAVRATDCRSIRNRFEPGWALLFSFSSNFISFSTTVLSFHTWVTSIHFQVLTMSSFIPFSSTMHFFVMSILLCENCYANIRWSPLLKQFPITSLFIRYAFFVTSILLCENCYAFIRWTPLFKYSLCLILRDRGSSSFFIMHFLSC